MRRLVLLLTAVAATLVVASGVALAVTKIGTDGPDTLKGTVVGPGESIQAAVNAADPGDTIVVRGVHREDVVIRKDGIKLRGDDAVIEAPPRAKADSPCSKTFGPTAICVLGGLNLQTFEITGPRVSDVSVSGFTIRGFEIRGQADFSAWVIEVIYAHNATVEENRITGNLANGISVAGSVNTTVAKNHVVSKPENGGYGIFVNESRNTTVVKNDVRSPDNRSAILVEESIDTTVAENDLVGAGAGVFVERNTTGTKILSNDISRSNFAGIYMAGPEPVNAKVVGNDISGGAWGMWVEDTKGGSIAGNTIHDNCAGMFFIAFPSTPVGEFEVPGNTIEDNTRSCRASQFGTNISGVGIALLGARAMEVTANQISGNVPSGPTAVSGGVVVATDPFFGGTIEPQNNTVTGNNFGNNGPDIFYDGSGSGNVLRPNNCNTSVPARLCN